MREEPIELAAERDRGDGLVHEGGRLDYNPGTREQCWAALRTAPGSLRVTASGDPLSGSPGVGGVSGLTVPPMLGGVLSAEFRSFLGNLPASTQVRLQRPFIPSRTCSTTGGIRTPKATLTAPMPTP